MLENLGNSTVATGLEKVSFHSNPKEKQYQRMLRDLLKKIRDTKGRFHAKMGSIKDRNGMDITEE